MLIKTYPLLAVAYALFLFSLAGSVTAQGTAAGPAPVQQYDSTARLLAGLKPTHPDHTALTTKAWAAHSRTIQASWARVRDGQLAAMKTWRTTELPKQCPVGNTLFYPFSGPDFLNAYTFFPECDTYVLFGLEKVGSMPDPAALKEKEFAQLLTDVRRAMINLFNRNYFVTTTMSKDFRTSHLHGMLPVMLMSMVLSGVEVVSIGAPPFAPVTGPNGKRRIDGVAIDFRVPGSPRMRRVIFYSLDASDKGLAEYPEFEKYLRGLAPTTTLIKSASYLLHITEFSKMRNVLLDNSEFLLQDDTGLPFAQLNKRGWKVQPYGRYGVPIKPFQGHHQKDLAALFKAGAKPLPFRFGYLRDEEENFPHLLVGRKTPAARQPDAR